MSGESVSFIVTFSESSLKLLEAIRSQQNLATLEDLLAEELKIFEPTRVEVVTNKSKQPSD